MYFIKSALCFVILLLCSSSLLKADDKEMGVSLLYSMSQAYINNPTIRAARRELSSVSEIKDQALSGWKPNVTAELGVNKAYFDGSVFGGNADGGVEKGASLTMEQPIFRGGRTVSSVESSKNYIKAQENILRLTEQDILLQAVTAHMNVVMDKALLSLSQKNKEIIKEQLNVIKDRFELGEVTKTDLSQAEARLAGSVADFIKARGNLDVSKAVYRQIVGIDVNILNEDNKAFEFNGDLDDALDIAMNNSPLILSAKYIKQSDENNIDVVSGELLPDVNLSASYSKKYNPQPGIIDDSTDKIIAITARVPLYQAGAVRSRIKEAKEKAKQRKEEIKEAEEKVRLLVISSWKNYQTAKAEILSRKKQVEAAKMAKEGVYAEEQAGERTILDILNADKELLDAEVNLVKAYRDEVVASYSLASAMGVLEVDK